MLCPRCRAVLPGGLTYCIYCGQPLAPAYPPPSSHAAGYPPYLYPPPGAPPYAAPYGYPYRQPVYPASGRLHIPMLVWSSVNVFLFTILGAIALALTGNKMGVDPSKCIFWQGGYYERIIGAMPEDYRSTDEI